MYQALYRKYRPKKFEDVVGQTAIIKTLTNSVLNNKITHAYLFTGPRGTGKTSVAKILAKIVNCENLNGVEVCNKCVSCTQTQNTDIIEIDAASNNGVDEIRDLRDKVNLVPSYGKYKVYIIDEVHMLTISAFNALLKTLEEPPKHIIFILATTDPLKIPNTILSRCQRYDFKKISLNDIKNKLTYICKEECIEAEDDAIELIAKLSDGGMRDSINLLDQLTAYTSEKITLKDVHDVYGTLNRDEIFEFLKQIFNKNLIDSFKSIEKMDNEGKNLAKILDEIIEFLKNVLIYCNSSDYFCDEEKKYYEEILNLISEKNIYTIIEILLEKIKSIKLTNNVKLVFELSIIKIIELLNTGDTPATSSGENIKMDGVTNIKIYEEPKKNLEKTITNEKIVINSQPKLEKLKKIRINNALSRFDKKELLKLKKDIDKINEYILDPDFGFYASILIDGELKAKGENNLIFMYKLKNLEEKFNISLVEIENLLLKVFNINYKPIAVFEDEWDKIKNEFNESLKNNSNNYKYIEEPSLDEIYNKLEINNESTKNEIENLFLENIEYD